MAIKGLPNPPAVFLGRDAELQWLAGAIDRGPVVLLTGPQGLGKTALVRKAMQALYPDKAARIAAVDGGEKNIDELRMELLRMAVRGLRRVPVDFRALQADPEQTALKTLEVAEKRGLWFFVDGLPFADVEEAKELLTLLASYAARSQWIVTCRPALRIPLLAGQTLHLDALEKSHMIELARAWAPHLGGHDLAQVVEAAGGSPEQLGHVLACGGQSDGALWLTRGLTKRAQVFVQALSVLSAPFPLEALFALAPDPGQAALSDLEGRGVLVRYASGFAVHSAVVGALGLAESHRQRLCHTAARSLQSLAAPEATVEAIRLQLCAGQLDEAAQLLDTRALDLFARGYAASLWRHIGAARDARFEKWRLKCAAELGNPTALAQVEETFEGAEEKLAWAETLVARGANGQALAQLTELKDATVLVAQRAAALRAGILLRQGRLSDAKASLSALAPSALRSAMDLHIQVAAGDLSSEPSRLAELLAQARGEAFGPKEEVLVVLAEAAVAARDRAGALQCLRLAQDSPRSSHQTLLTTRRLQIVQARLNLSAGSLDDAQSTVEGLRQFARGKSALRPWLDLLDLRGQLARGDLEGWDRKSQAAGSDDDTDVACSAELRACHVQHRMLLGHLPEGDGACGPGIYGLVVTGWRNLALARHGHKPRRLLSSCPTAELWVLDKLRAATESFLSGQPAQALVDLGAAEQQALRAEEMLLALEVAALRCDAALCLGEQKSWHESIEAFERLAASTGSSRFRSAALFHRALATTPCPFGVLESAAAAIHEAPVEARRARVLLGYDAALDGVDLLVLRGIAARGLGGAKVAIAAPEGPWRCGWGLDYRLAAVWLPGRTVDLSSKRLLWQILDATAQAGGSIDKESLILRVWQEREYHPLRHDGKLHTAVRKLRAEIEDDPKKPARFVTTEQGYRMTAPLRTVSA